MANENTQDEPSEVDASGSSHCSVAVHADLVVVFEAYQRLKKDGWTDPHPWTDKDYYLLLIEPGSTGVHVGTCDGEEFGYWVADGYDLWPSRPYLVKRTGKR